MQGLEDYIKKYKDRLIEATNCSSDHIEYK